MAASTLVADHLLSGAGLIDELGRRGFPVVAACWVKPADDDRRDFYLVVDGVEKTGTLPVYRTVHDILGPDSDSWLPASAVRVIGRNDSVASAILGKMPRHMGEAELLSHRGWLGGLDVEEVYIYPHAGRGAGRATDVGNGHFPPSPRTTARVLGRRRLRRAVRHQLRPTDVLGPFTPEEMEETRQLTKLGVAPDQARILMWERRKKSRESQVIPAGTIVKASYAAWWGEKPEDDTNPLLLVETDDGAQGLTFLDNAEALEESGQPTG